MRFAKYLLNKLRFKRLSLAPGIKLLSYGAIYSGTYTQWKHDPKPTIFIMYSGNKYTHAINVNYLTRDDKMWLGKTIYMIKRGAQNIDGIMLYKMIKLQRKSIINTAYRVYFTSLLNMKLISAGITYLDKMVYTTTDSWINTLNEMIKPDEISNNQYTPRGIAYTPTELSERITRAINTTDITKSTVDNGAIGTAKWVQ